MLPAAPILISDIYRANGEEYSGEGPLKTPRGNLARSAVLSAVVARRSMASRDVVGVALSAPVPCASRGGAARRPTPPLRGPRCRRLIRRLALFQPSSTARLAPPVFRPVLPRGRCSPLSTDTLYRIASNFRDTAPIGASRHPRAGRHYIPGVRRAQGSPHFRTIFGAQGLHR